MPHRDSHTLNVKFNVLGEPELAFREQQYNNLAELTHEVQEILMRFGTPSHGRQIIEINIESYRNPQPEG